MNTAGHRRTLIIIGPESPTSSSGTTIITSPLELSELFTRSHKRHRLKENSVKPISPVLKEFVQHEIVFAKDQPEYLPLPALRIDDPANPIVSRWTFSPRRSAKKVAAGADILLTQYIFEDLFHPLHLEVSE